MYNMLLIKLHHGRMYYIYRSETIILMENVQTTETRIVPVMNTTEIKDNNMMDNLTDNFRASLQILKS